MNETSRTEGQAEGVGATPHGNGRAGAVDDFLRNAWYVAGFESEFQSNLPAGRLIINEPVVFYRTGNGKLVALEDRCPHRWAPLSLGRVEGDQLRCMYHGLKFSADGSCREIPGQDRVPKALCIRSYPVVERHTVVWVWMGEASLADPKRIPDLGMLDQPWRRISRGTLDYEANYALISDNLLDLAHIDFLHEKTLGRPVQTASGHSTRPEIIGGSGARLMENGVRVEGWVTGSRIVTLPKKVPDGDYWSRVDYVVPGIYIACGQMYPKGTALECQGLQPGSQWTPLSDGMSIQAVTPMSARKTRYFYSLGHRASDTDEQESAAIWGIVNEAFSEDLRMIQAQQKMIDAHPGRRMLGLSADRGLTLFRNLMKRLMDEEVVEAVRT